MVSFNCDGCGDVVTKGKIKNHANRCRIGSVSCLDCSRTFSYPSKELDAHTQCVSEAQKYQGKLYKAKADKRPNKRAKEDVAVEDAPAEQAVVVQPVQPVVVEEVPSALVTISFQSVQEAMAGAKRTKLSSLVGSFLESEAHRSQVEDAIKKTLTSASEKGLIRFDGKKVKVNKHKK